MIVCPQFFMNKYHLEFCYFQKTKINKKKSYFLSTMFLRLLEEQWNLGSYNTCTLLSNYSLTHFILETPKKLIGKQCRPRSDANGLAIFL